MKFKDDLQNYQLNLFHKALEEYFNRDEDVKTKEAYKKKSYPFEFCPISKKELKCLEQLRALYEDIDDNGERKINQIPFPSLIPTLTYCPHFQLDIFLIMNELSEYNINVVTGELVKR